MWDGIDWSLSGLTYAHLRHGRSLNDDFFHLVFDMKRNVRINVIRNGYEWGEMQDLPCTKVVLFLLKNDFEHEPELDDYKFTIMKVRSGNPE